VSERLIRVDDCGRRRSGLAGRVRRVRKNLLIGLWWWDVLIIIGIWRSGWGWSQRSLVRVTGTWNIVLMRLVLQVHSGVVRHYKRIETIIVIREDVVVIVEITRRKVRNG